MTQVNVAVEIPPQVKEVPTLVEQVKKVKSLWKGLSDGDMKYEVSVHKVCKDVQIPLEVLRNAQFNKTSNMINYDEFKMMYCKPILRHWLVSLSPKSKIITMKWKEMTK